MSGWEQDLEVEQAAAVAVAEEIFARKRAIADTAHNESQQAYKHATKDEYPQLDELMQDGDLIRLYTSGIVQDYTRRVPPDKRVHLTGTGVAIISTNQYGKTANMEFDQTLQTLTGILTETINNTDIRYTIALYPPKLSFRRFLSAPAPFSLKIESTQDGQTSTQHFGVRQGDLLHPLEYVGSPAECKSGIEAVGRIIRVLLPN